MGYFKKALQGTGWMGSLRVITRGFGLVKLAIIARILTPEDFGIFGIAAIVLALLETFTEPGVSLALIQQEEEVDEYVDTAWIISVVRGFAISILILILSKPIALFFKQPDSLSIIMIAAIIPAVRGFLNPAAVNFVKKLEFKKEFIIRSITQVSDISTSIAFALYLRSAEALLFGMIIGALVEVSLTFIMLKIKPRFNFSKARAKKLVNFGKWVNIGGIMSYLVDQIDDIIVGRVLGTASLGIYQMAFKISVVPAVELTETFSKVTFPVFSKIAGDKKRLKKAVIKTTSVITLIALPAMVAFLTFPEVIIEVVLGSQWLSAAVPLKILAVFGLIRATTIVPSVMLYSVGRPDVAAKLRALRLLSLLVLIFPLIAQFQLIGAAYAVLISAALVQPLLWIYTIRFFRK